MILSGAIDPRIWQAVIAGAFVALGWIMNGWQNRRERRARRDERVRDVHRALYAEISAYLNNLGSEQALDIFCADMVARMQDDPDFAPLIPTESDDLIFTAIVEEIHVLPRTSIDAVVLYYRQLGAISALISDMRAPSFRALAAGQRIQMYSDYIEMKKQALRYGVYSLRLIAVYAKEGAEAAKRDEEAIRQEAAPASVNTPDADPSGRLSG